MRAAATPDANESLSELWEALVTGRDRAVDAFIDDERCFLVVRPARPDERLPPLANARNRAILTRVLLGEPQKHVAYEFDVSASSITSIAAQYAHAMGFAGSVSRLPILLVMAAHAAARGATHFVAASAGFEHAGVPHRVLCAPRPDPARWASLSDAEREVVTLLIERYANADIARLRQRSMRTVANQLSSAMHKLGARGRSEIISRVLERQDGARALSSTSVPARADA
jgi:DNA-binding CsgD family transcriptional regulator